MPLEKLNRPDVPRGRTAGSQLWHMVQGVVPRRPSCMELAGSLNTTRDPIGASREARDAICFAEWLLSGAVGDDDENAA